MPTGDGDRLRFGVCWHPEHWPAERWTVDTRLMIEAGLDCVRCFERAWMLIEPEEGTLDWTFVDRVLDCCGEAGLGVIAALPTAQPPSWMAERYPRSSARRLDGRPWGGRRCLDYSDDDYRRCCRRLAEAMAARYAGDRRIIAWQLDDELWGQHDEVAGEAVLSRFRSWCERSYGEIGVLNEAWGLRFDAAELRHFGQVTLPTSAGSRSPHQWIDYRRFLAELGAGFVAELRDLVKTADPEALVLLKHPGGPSDRATLFDGIDVYGHRHSPGEVAPDLRSAFGLDYGRFRPYARRLWALEQQSSQIGDPTRRQPNSPPGELSVSALQSIGHGCDLVAWFRWRGQPAGEQLNIGGLLPHWGDPARHYQELQELVAALRPHAERIAATRPLVTVARLCNFVHDNAHRVETWIERHIGPPDCARRALRLLGLNEDVLRAEDLRPGDGYRVALLPHAFAIGEAGAAALAQWVEAGGVLVVGPLAGHRNGRLQADLERTPPGVLMPLTGTVNLESTSWDGPMAIATITGSRVDVGAYAEVIIPQAHDVQVLARHMTGWLAGRAAVTERNVGLGRVIHSGVPLGDALCTWLWVDAKLPKPRPAVATHEAAAEVLMRRGDGYDIYIVLNHGNGPVVCYLHQRLRDLISGAPVLQSFTLPGHSWRVLIDEG